MDDLPKPLARKIKGAFLDSLYAFLDGLVHVAFSEGHSANEQKKDLTSRLGSGEILHSPHSARPPRTGPRLTSQFSAAFKTDMAADVKMLLDVTDQLDKILFCPAGPFRE
jgi:exocyst complex component 2